MSRTYYLENIALKHKEDRRHFLKPTDKEIKNIKVGEMVRLFFVLNFETKDNCRAERMWIEVCTIDGHNFRGYLTNKPIYIKDLNIGDIIEFNKDNIATVIIKSAFDEQKKAIISLKALQKREINWCIKDSPLNEEDSGWQLFYGDETDKYLDDPKNSTIISLEKVLNFEPKLEQVFASTHKAFEWNEDKMEFVEAKD